MMPSFSEGGKVLFAMSMTYLGHLQHHDPLYGYLKNEIEPEIHLSGATDYRVFRFHASNDVYLYEETHSLRRLIGKFYFRPFESDRNAAHNRMEREFANLNWMRSQGFCGENHHYIARPLGRNAALNELLLEEFCYGETLSSVILRALRTGNEGLLYRKLAALACFLSRFHNLTANHLGVDFNATTDYAAGIMTILRHCNWTSDHRNQRYFELLRAWHDRPEMWQDTQVAVHGDATPENFLFGDGNYVISFDLERLRRADRCFDLGRLAAEVAHFFMLYTGNRFRAEPFIGNFLWEYCTHFPDRDAAFRAITKRLPFYMGINFLRIGRNAYFDWNYRQLLLNAASECFKGGLR